MPDKDGFLSQEEIQKILSWLRTRAKDKPCPVCDHPNWTVGSHLISGLIHRGGAFVVGGAAYPQFFITCNNCLYTRHFMANPVLQLDKEEKGESKKDEGAETPKGKTVGKRGGG